MSEGDKAMIIFTTGPESEDSFSLVIYAYLNAVKGQVFNKILCRTLLPLKKQEYVFLFWAFTNKLVRKPPLGQQKYTILVRKGWRFYIFTVFVFFSWTVRL